MTVAPWYYFGCGNQAGHYLFRENGQSVHMPQGVERELGHMDGVLPPHSSDKFRAPLYVASFSMLGGLGYCALSWWDCSVDKRPGSNSTVFAPGLDWDPETLLCAAQAKLPWVFSRLPFPLVLGMAAK